MARKPINNLVFNGDFENIPPFVAATSNNNSVVDGTSNGSVTGVSPSFNKQKYGWKMNSYATTNASVRYESGFMKVTGTACKERVNLTLGNRVYSDLNDSRDICLNLIPVKPNTSYIFSVKMKTFVENGVGTPGIYGAMVRVALHSGTSYLYMENITNSSNNNKISQTTEWTTYTKTFTTNANATYANIDFGIYGDSSNYADITAYFDKISLDTEVSHSRTTATHRQPATNRIAVRDMGTALRFDGTGVNVAVVHTSLFTFNKNLTCAFWFNPTKYQSDAEIFSKGISSGYPFSFRWTDGGGLLRGDLSFKTYDGTNNPGTSKKIELKNKWIFVVGTCNASLLNLYVDGVLVDSKPDSTIVSTDNTLNINFGKRSGSVQYFNGLIDEPRIWNRALSATEISQLYKNNIVPRNGLVGEWLFNEATGTTAYDTSGNGNNGTITGATYTLDVPIIPRSNVS